MNASAETALRIFLPAYFIAYILICYTWTARSVRRTYGVDPLTVGERHPISALAESYRNAMFGAALALAFGYAAFPRIVESLGQIPLLTGLPVRAAGVTVLLGSLVLVRVAQRDLKGSWRVGIDLEGRPTELIMTGLYQRSRNPIYTGMIATSAGLFLTLPNAVTLSIGLVAILLLRVTVLAEEDYLLTTHGEAYEAYRRRTRRW